MAGIASWAEGFIHSRHPFQTVIHSSIHPFQTVIHSRQSLIRPRRGGQDAVLAGMIGHTGTQGRRGNQKFSRSQAPPGNARLLRLCLNILAPLGSLCPVRRSPGPPGIAPVPCRRRVSQPSLASIGHNVGAGLWSLAMMTRRSLGCVICAVSKWNSSSCFGRFLFRPRTRTIPTPRWHEIHPDRDGLRTLPGSLISCRPFQNPEQKQHKLRYDPISQTASPGGASRAVRSQAEPGTEGVEVTATTGPAGLLYSRRYPLELFRPSFLLHCSFPCTTNAP